MRGAMDAGEYKHIALGLLFLRYVSEAFARRHDLIAKEGGDPEDRDEYLAENTFLCRRLPAGLHSQRSRRMPASA